jgi:putative transposase
MIEQTVQELAPLVGTRPACRALGASVATIYRRRRPPEPRARRPRPAPSRALSEAERQAVLERLHSPRFVDCAPAQVYARLLDEGRYLCSERTMYRLLEATHGGVRERRDQLTHPAYAKPELLACRPNELWSWDISKLKGPAKWTYYLPVRDPGRVQPLHRRLDGPIPRAGEDRPGADHASVRAATNHPASS